MRQKQGVALTIQGVMELRSTIIALFIHDATYQFVFGR